MAESKRGINMPKQTSVHNNLTNTEDRVIDIIHELKQFLVHERKHPVQVSTRYLNSLGTLLGNYAYSYPQLTDDLVKNAGLTYNDPVGYQTITKLIRQCNAILSN